MLQLLVWEKPQVRGLKLLFNDALFPRWMSKERDTPQTHAKVLEKVSASFSFVLSNSSAKVERSWEGDEHGEDTKFVA